MKQNMEIKIAKRNEVQDKFERNNPNKFLKYNKEIKRFGNKVKINIGHSVDDFTIILSLQGIQRTLNDSKREKLAN